MSELHRAFFMKPHPVPSAQKRGVAKKDTKPRTDAATVYGNVMRGQGPVDVTVGRLVDERNTEGPRGTYGCACVADSAHACAEIRYGYRDLPEPCECLCHQWRDDDDE